MTDCPNMIGLGHVVENLGFEFSWTPLDGSSLSKDGMVVPLEVIAGVPVIHGAAAMLEHDGRHDGFARDAEKCHRKRRVVEAVLGTPRHRRPRQAQSHRVRTCRCTSRPSQHHPHARRSVLRDL
jgi:hypothetical protein